MMDPGEPPVLRQTRMLLANQLPDVGVSWAPIVLMIIIAVGFAAGNVILSAIIGPKRTGSVKEGAYESGMMPIGTTQKRFNVRFYIVAMIFLVIDVEIVFFYPFASIFAPYVKQGMNAPLYPGATISSATGMLISMGIFVTILLLAYIYAWGKGVYRWD